MKKTGNKIISKKGFTLIEMLMVVAIIGILSSVVMVSMSGGREKANRASAITTLSSVLSELVICQDDNGNLNAYSAGAPICTAAGHTAIWPNISKTGWVITAASRPAATNAEIATYTFSATKAGQTTVTCNYAKNSCE